MILMMFFKIKKLAQRNNQVADKDLLRGTVYETKKLTFDIESIKGKIENFGNVNKI